MLAQQTVRPVQITGEISERGFIIQVGGHYLLEINRSPEMAANRMRGEVVLTPLRSRAKLFPDAHVAKCFCSFVQQEYPEATVVDVDTTDRHLAASLHRARQNPVNPEDVNRRTELFKTQTRVRPR